MVSFDLDFKPQERLSLRGYHTAESISASSSMTLFLPEAAGFVLTASNASSDNSGAAPGDMTWQINLSQTCSRGAISKMK
jgi:hypothetical protein